MASIRKRRTSELRFCEYWTRRGLWPNQKMVRSLPFELPVNIVDDIVNQVDVLVSPEQSFCCVGEKIFPGATIHLRGQQSPCRHVIASEAKQSPPFGIEIASG
jgi:hypothetical protein